MRGPEELERCLREQGFAIAPTRGTSMQPLLHEGRSLVRLAAVGPEAELRKGDVVLYRRADGGLVLHRIMKAEDGGIFWLCGDHQCRLEERVCRDQILAVAQGFFRNGQYVDEQTRWYGRYKTLWTGSLMVRRCLLACLRLSGLDRRI